MNTQQGMFQHEDLPMFSGTPQTTVAGVLDQTPQSHQMSMSCPVCWGAGYVNDDGRLKTCTCEAGKKRIRIVRDVAGLSSRTMATLTGQNMYDMTDEIQGAFIKFTATAEETFDTWVDAWDAFQERSDNV